MASSRGNPEKYNGPKDAQIIASMMKDLGIEEYEPQVLNHLLEFNYSNYYYSDTNLSCFNGMNNLLILFVREHNTTVERC